MAMAMARDQAVGANAQPTFRELFTPKLITVLREGYSFRDLRTDAISGLTVAIVAIPLSMAIAIASGVGPERGLFTSIVGGFLVSALGGSRFQIGGPAGAFIVLVAATVAQFGVDGLLLAVFLSGIILTAIGALRLGTFIKYIPYPVTVGFTAGIAVIIAAGEISDLFGLKLAAPEPAALLPKLHALVQAAGTVSPVTAGLSAATLVVIIAIRRLRPHWPAYLCAIAAAAGLAALLHLPLETIGTRFGAMPHMLSAPQLPDLSLTRIITVLPAAVSFALLGSIESLLSAVVADSMTGRRHRSNCELVAQGLANIASALFGGICVTGTIARTATNVRAGARGPLSGMLHACFLLLILAVAAPLAGYIPLGALAAVLVAVAWNMAEKHQFATLMRASRADAMVLSATFLLVIFRGLTAGILVGFSLAAVVFIHRMAGAVAVSQTSAVLDPDLPDSIGDNAPEPAAIPMDPRMVVYRISGAFFFGAAATVSAALERTGERPQAYVIDLSQVAILDSTAAATIAGFVRQARRHGARVALSGLRAPVRRTLRDHGVTWREVALHAQLATAVAAIRQDLQSNTAAERHSGIFEPHGARTPATGRA